MSSRRMTFGQATLEAMQYAMDEDPSVVVIGEDISWGGNFGQFRGLVDRYGPERVVDMPISESLIVALAVGASSAGLKVVASMSFVEFTLGAMDEIVNQAAKFRYMFGGQTSVPIVLRASDGIRGSSGAQHSSSLEGMFCNIPGIKVVAPSTLEDAYGMLGAALAGQVPADALLCQPGTHCKWAWMTAGEVARFATAMTGELFALLRGQGLLARQLGG